MDDSQATFDNLKEQAEYLYFEADHLLKRAVQFDCLDNDKVQDAQEPCNKLRTVVYQMSFLLSTNDVNKTKERAIIRRKYEQASQEINARLSKLMHEIKLAPVPDLIEQQESASSGISSAQQSRTVHSESAFSGDWSLESLDGRVTSSASESQERDGGYKSACFPVIPIVYGRSSGGSTTSRTSSEAIPIPGITSQSQFRAGGAALNPFNAIAGLDAQLKENQRTRHQQQRSDASSTKTMSYGSGDTVVARSLHLMKTSGEEDAAPTVTAAHTDQDASCVQPRCSTTARPPLESVSDWSSQHMETQVHRLPDHQDSPDTADHSGEGAVSGDQGGAQPTRASSRTPSPPTSRDPSSSPLLRRAPVRSYASIERSPSPVASSPSRCDEAALLPAEPRCCGRGHCNKVLLLSLVIVLQAIIIAGLIFWKLYFP